MRSKFKGYYKPTEVEFSQLWENCIFVFDTNTLLNIYRYSENTRDSFLNILDKIKDRIWIPYHVGYEYQENRLEVISQQTELYDSIKKELNETTQKIKTLLDGRKKHPLIDATELMETLKESFQTVEAYIEGVKAKHPNLMESDDLRERITDLFDGKVGEKYSEDEFGKKIKEGETRYKQQIPPGYKDDPKGDIKKFGDFIVWAQLIDFAKVEKKPLIFITADGKEDWWSIHKGKTIGPRPELIQEMSLQGGVSFYMYQPDQFISYAQKFLQLQDQKEVIAEMIDVQKRDLERSRKTLADYYIEGDFMQSSSIVGNSLQALGEAIARSTFMQPNESISNGFSAFGEALARSTLMQPNESISNGFSALGEVLARSSLIQPSTTKLTEILIALGKAIAHSNIIQLDDGFKNIQEDNTNADITQPIDVLSVVETDKTKEIETKNAPQSTIVNTEQNSTSEKKGKSATKNVKRKSPK